MIGIYKITSPTGRVYIGQSIDTDRRFRFYNQPCCNCKGQPLLYRSLKKYGANAHTFEVIEECEFEQLNVRERYWQEFYNVLEGGLNCYLTETNTLPKRHSEETKKKISKSNMNKIVSDETRLKQSVTKKANSLGNRNNFFGKQHSSEFKRDRSIKRTGGGNPNAKIVVNLETGIFYDCAKDAVKTTNFKYDVFKNWLSGKYSNKTSFRYV